MIQLTEPYKKRPVRFIELWEWQGWHMKIYGISAQREYPPEYLVESAKRIAEERLPIPAEAENRYGVGFLIVHEGATGNYAHVEWWSEQDILQHHLYGAPTGNGGELQYHWPPGASYCVWEMAVCWFEREAWVEQVLSRPEARNMEGYLERRLNADV